MTKPLIPKSTKCPYAGKYGGYREDAPPVSKLGALLDSLIDASPDTARRFIETQLARLALRERLARFKEGKK